MPRSFSIAILLLVTASTLALGPAALAARTLSADLVPLDTVLDLNAREHPAIEQPSRFAADKEGHVYLLDRKTNRVSKLGPQGAILWTAAGTPQNPRRFNLLSDVALGPEGSVWVLDEGNNVACRFTDSGRFVRTVALARYPRRIAIDRAGELVVNPGTGPHLFDVYSVEGKYLRSFGERIKYPSDAADFLFNTGSFAVGANGNLYFAFLYPGLLRAYSPQGQLLWEQSIPFPQPLPEPDLQLKVTGASTAAGSIQFHAGALDLTQDRSGNVLALSSGAPWATASAAGTTRLDAWTPGGSYLGAIALPVAATQLADSPRGLFLLAARSTLGRFLLTLDGKPPGRTRMR